MTPTTEPDEVLQDKLEDLRRIIRDLGLSECVDSSLPAAPAMRKARPYTALRRTGYYL